MRLVFVSTGDPNLDTFDTTISTGGSGPIWRLAREATKKGHEVTIIAGTYHHRKEVTIKGVTIRNVPTPEIGGRVDWVINQFPNILSLGASKNLSTSVGMSVERLFGRLVFSKRASEEVRRIDPDAVFLRDRVSGVFPLRTEFPSVFTVAAPDASDYFYASAVNRYPANRLLFRYKQTLEEYCLSRADRIIVMNEQMADYLRRKQLGPVTVVTIGMDKSEFCSEGITDCEPLILFVGRMDGNKRPEWVLEAFESTAPSEYDLVFLGDGPRRSYLKTQAQQSPREESIHIRGLVPREEVLKTMRRAAIFVLPSEFETCGNVIIEAMGSGCAVITSDTHGGQQLVDDGRTGRIFAKDCPEGLASVLSELTADEQRRRELAENAYDQARQEHTSEIITEQYLDQARSIIAGE